MSISVRLGNDIEQRLNTLANSYKMKESMNQNGKQEEYFEKAINFLKEYAQNTNDIANSDFCKRQLEKLTQPPSLQNRIFYLVFNLKIQEITWSRFVYQTLGFQDVDSSQPSKNQLTFRGFLSRIKSNYLPIYIAFGKCAYRLAERNPQIRENLHKLDMKWIMQFPIRLKDGKYYWTNQIGMPFELDANNNLVSNLTIYEIGLEYSDQKMVKPMILAKGGRERRTDLEKILQQQLSEGIKH